MENIKEVKHRLIKLNVKDVTSHYLDAMLMTIKHQSRLLRMLHNL